MPMALRKMHKDKVQCENMYVDSKHVILLYLEYNRYTGLSTSCY